MDPNVKFSKDDGLLFDNPGRYRRLVGKLIYLTVTRPDITLAVGVVSQFMRNPRQGGCLPGEIGAPEVCPTGGLLYSLSIPSSARTASENLRLRSLFATQ